MKQEVFCLLCIDGKPYFFDPDPIVRMVHEDSAGRYCVWDSTKCYLNNRNQFGLDVGTCGVIRLPDRVKS